jgi:periplasmic protein TonB
MRHQRGRCHGADLIPEGWSGERRAAPDKQHGGAKMRISPIAIAVAATLAAPVPAQQTTPAVPEPMAHAAPEAMPTPATQVSLIEWTKRVEAEIGQNLRNPTGFHSELNGGTVRVKFNCTPEGGTRNVSILTGSGSRAYDQEALRVVTRLVQMHPLPTGMTNDQSYEAIILFGPSPGKDYDASLRSIHDESLRRTAWFKGPKVASTDPGSAGTSGRAPPSLK